MKKLEKYPEKHGVLTLLNLMFLERRDIRPIFYFDQGFRYPLAEQVLDLSPPEIVKLMDELAEAGGRRSESCP